MATITFLAFLSATAATDFFAGDPFFGVVAVGHSLVSMSLSASNFFLPDFCNILASSDHHHEDQSILKLS